MHALFECPEDVNEITKNHTKAVSGELCLPPLGSGDILFFPGRPSFRLSVCPSVCLSVCLSQIVSAL